MTRLFIKYMVSLRCKLIVKDELMNLGIHCASIDLGTCEIIEELSPEKHDLLSINLKKVGLELMDDQKSILIERIKNTVVEMIHYSDEMIKEKYSVFISKKLGYNYTYLSNLFSEVKGITIQNFIIQHKIERVKELLLYGELNLNEISHMMHYSSVAHLSNQFKKVTGLSPSYYKLLKKKRDQNLENL